MRKLVIGLRATGAIMGLSVVTRDQVLEKLNSDDTAGAVRLARELLSDDPNNSDGLGLLGIALEAAGDFAAGADALGLALSRPSPPSIRLRNTANLAALLVASGQKQKAAKLFDLEWDWATSAELGINERRCIALLGEIMTLLDLRPSLLELHLPIVAKSQHDWPILKQAILALSFLGRQEEALRVLEAHSSAGIEETEYQAILAYLCSSMGRTKDAVGASAAYIRGAPAYIASAKLEPWFTIGVINPEPTFDNLIKSLGHQHFNTNFPAQLSRKLGNRYNFASILLRSGPSSVETFCKYAPKVVINNIVNPEQLLTGDNLAEAETLAQSIGVPIVNPAQLASLCTRHMNFERFAALANVITPRLKRYTLDGKRLNELETMIEGSFSYPMIVRTVGDHDGNGMVRVDTRSALHERLSSLRQKQIYVIQYLSTKHRGGYYRKLRAAFVEGVPTIMRADYDHDWIVQGRKKAGRLEFYQEHSDLLADANDIVIRPAERLGTPALAALEAIGRLLPLDIFGLDFDVDEQGSVVFFEANACMNLFGNTVPEYPFPPAADATLLERMEQLLQRKANARIAASASAH